MEDKSEEICREITESDYPAMEALAEEYLSIPEHMRERYEIYPAAFCGYFAGTKLLGITYGWPRREEVPGDPSFSLQGIAIRFPYHASGRGGKLLHFFETQVEMLGFHSIGVGSAEGYPERFYLKNGYHPTEYKIIRQNGEAAVIPLDAPDSYEKLDRKQLLERESGQYGFVVFQKNLV